MSGVSGQHEALRPACRICGGPGTIIGRFGPEPCPGCVGVYVPRLDLADAIGRPVIHPVEETSNERGTETD